MTKAKGWKENKMIGQIKGKEQRNLEEVKTEIISNSSWDNLRTEQRPGVELFDEKLHVVFFQVDKPFETTSQTYENKPLYLFDVLERDIEKTLIVSSIKLAVEIKKYTPLKGKTLKIQRSGKGIKINYKVEAV